MLHTQALAGNRALAFENMVAQWGGLKYASLSVLLVHLNYAYTVHRAHHWTARGDSFYGDHLMFQRLYEGITSEIDSVAEKIVGLEGPDCVNLPLQAAQLARLSRDYGTALQLPTASDIAMRSLVVEQQVLACARYAAEALTESGALTRGVDNMLQGIEDAHETSIYLLGRRAANTSA